MKKLIVLLLPILLSASSLDSLLQEYKATADLSAVTKKESAGLVQVFTRQDLETMQAYTLKDVMKLIPLLHYTLAPNNIYLFSKASVSFMPTNILRIYINDHDVTSASFGSALPIWGNMPIEYIDHIEIYKGSSSIEFGNEPAVLIIRIYTKTAERDLGSKLRLNTDSRGSKGIDFYHSSQFDNGSLFGYVHVDSLGYKKYYHDGYPLKRDSRNKLAYLHTLYKNHSLEIARYDLNAKPFLGNGKEYHPIGGGLDATHSYLHYQYKKDATLLEASYDHLDYDRTYLDAEGTYYNLLGTPTFASYWNMNYIDDIYYTGARHEFQFEQFEATVGTFLKRKKITKDGHFDSNTVHDSLTKDMKSIYGDFRYYFDTHRKFMGFFSIKGDYYSFDHGIKGKNKLILRAGLIRNWNHWQIKTTLVKNYFPIEMYKLYSVNNIPYITNPYLKNENVRIAFVETSYKKGAYRLMLRYGHEIFKNQISYSPTIGFYNIHKKIYSDIFEGELQYNFNPLNNIVFNIYYSNNSQNVRYSPSFGAITRLYNSFGGWSIYHEFSYKNSYYHKITHEKIASSIDYTAAIKYAINKDLYIGIRGENLFNKGFKQTYSKIKDQTYTVYDRRVIFNLEYTF